MIWRIFLILTLACMPQFGYAGDKTTLRDMAVEQMFSYAQSLNDRGDRVQAKQVLERILNMDPAFKPAVDMARQYGITVPKAADCCAVFSNKATKSQSVTIQAKAKVLKSPEVVDPNADLKAALAKEDQAIDALSGEIQNLRSSLEASSHE